MANQSKEKKPNKVCFTIHNVEMRGILLSFISLLIVLIKGNNSLVRFFVREKISKLERSELLVFLNELTFAIAKTGPGQQKLLKHKKLLTAANLAKLEKARVTRPKMISTNMGPFVLSVENIDGKRVLSKAETKFYWKQYEDWKRTPMGEAALLLAHEIVPISRSYFGDLERYVQVQYESSLRAYVRQGESE